MSAEPIFAVGKRVGDYIFEAIGLDNGKIIIIQWTEDRKRMEAMRTLHNHSSAVKTAALGCINENLILASVDYNGDLFVYFFSCTDLEQTENRNEIDDETQESKRKDWLGYMTRIPNGENKYRWNGASIAAMTFSEPTGGKITLVCSYESHKNMSPSFITIEAKLKETERTELPEETTEEETSEPLSFADRYFPRTKQSIMELIDTIKDIMFYNDEEDPLPTTAPVRPSYDFTVRQCNAAKREVWKLVREEENGREILKFRKMDVEFSQAHRIVFGGDNKILVVNPHDIVRRTSWIAIQEYVGDITIVVAREDETKDPMMCYTFKRSTDEKDVYVCFREAMRYELEVRQRIIGYYWNYNKLVLCRDARNVDTPELDAVVIEFK